MRSSIVLLMSFIITVFSYGFRLDGIDFNQRMDGENGGYREFSLVNDSTEKQRYKINILKGDKNDGSKYITVFPKVVTIEPRDKAVFKVFADANGAKEGLYDFNLEFKPIGIPTIKKTKSGKVGGTTNINIAPLVEMYGYVGNIDFQEKLKVENIEIVKDLKKGVLIKAKISNESYAVIEFGVMAYGKNDYFYGGGYATTLGGEKSSDIKVNVSGLNEPEKINKLVLYRSGSNGVEILKTVVLSD